MKSTFWRDQVHGLGISVLRAFLRRRRAQPFQLDLETLEKEDSMRSALKSAQLQDQSPGTTGYVDDFACHLLGAGVCEPQNGEHQQ